MSSPRTVNCIRLKREAEGMSNPPFPNELGKRVFENVSKEAWKDWLAHSTMLINEYRLQLGTPDANTLLLKECEKFFFGEGSERPKEFLPQS